MFKEINFRLSQDELHMFKALYTDLGRSIVTPTIAPINLYNAIMRQAKAKNKTFKEILMDINLKLYPMEVMVFVKKDMERNNKIYANISTLNITGEEKRILDALRINRIIELLTRPSDVEWLKNNLGTPSFIRLHNAVSELGFEFFTQEEINQLKRIGFDFNGEVALADELTKWGVGPKTIQKLTNNGLLVKLETISKEEKSVASF